MSLIFDDYYTWYILLGWINGWVVGEEMGRENKNFSKSLAIKRKKTTGNVGKVTGSRSFVCVISCWLMSF